MIREQQFTPDTCANLATGDVCVVVESWDDTSNPVARTHNYVRHEKVCSFHSLLGSTIAAYNRMYDENRRKNTAFLAAQSVKAILIEQFKWSYDANGLLTIDLGSNYSNAQKAALQANLDVQFGQGKVTVR